MFLGGIEKDHWHEMGYYDWKILRNITQNPCTLSSTWFFERLKSITFLEKLK